MISKAHRNYWALYRQLPAEIQRVAVEKHRLWQRDPFHPSLHFKHLGNDVWSVRVNRNYRALGRRKGELIVWFWIGTHEEYNRLIK